MQPAIRPGDELEIVAVTRAQLQVGQVVAVCKGDRNVIAHRLVDICPPHVITVGDNSLLLDAPSPIDDVLGVVVSGRRGGQLFRIGIGMPFPTVYNAKRKQRRLELVGPERAHTVVDLPGMVRMPFDDLEAHLLARKQAGIPILALCDNGRGSSDTLAYYLNTFDHVMLASGVLSGYGHSMQYEVDDHLIDEAVRIPDVTTVCSLL